MSTEDPDIDALLARAAALRAAAAEDDSELEVVEVAPPNLTLVKTPEPEPVLLPPVIPRDPIAEVEEVLRRAREARGAPEATVRPPPQLIFPEKTDDPFASAEAALKKAAEARSRPGSAHRAAELRADIELKRLKRLMKKD